MSIAVRCICGKTLRAKETFAGKRVNCPSCSAVVVIPLPLPRDATERVQPKRELNTAETNPNLSPSQRPRAIGEWAAWAGFSGFLIALAIALIVFFQSRQRRDADLLVVRKVQDADRARRRERWEEAIVLLQEAMIVPHSTKKDDCRRLLNEILEARTAWREAQLIAAAHRAVDDGQLLQAMRLLKGYSETFHMPQRRQADGLLKQIEIATSTEVATEILRALTDEELAAPDYRKLETAYNIEGKALRTAFEASLAKIIPDEQARREGIKEEKRADQLARYELLRTEAERLAQLYQEETEVERLAQLKREKVRLENEALAREEAIAIEAPTGRVSETYDRIDDTSVLEADLGVIHSEAKAKLELKLFRDYDGKGRTNPGLISLMFIGTSEDGWQYLDYHTIVLLMDNERLKDKPEHHGSVKRGYVLELLHVYITDAQFKRLAIAKSIEGAVGSDNFQLTADQIKVVREFAAYVHNPQLEVKMRK